MENITRIRITTLIDGRYKLLHKIGQGGQGTVDKYLDTQSKTIVAIKKIPAIYKGEQIDPVDLQREWLMLRFLNHRNIIEVFGSELHANEFCVILEFMECSLYQYLRNMERDLEPMLIKSYLYQLLSGLKHCHDEEVVHCDIKIPNILIDRKGNLKICDFGNAFMVSDIPQYLETQLTTLWYRAPEVLMGCGNYSTKMDMWAVGCVFFEMVVRRHPFPGTDEKNQLELVFGLFGTPSEKSWPALSHSKDFKLNDFQPQKKRPLKMFVPSLCSNGLDLMASFFKLNPEKRISAEKALKHPYFDDYKALRTIPVKS